MGDALDDYEDMIDSTPGFGRKRPMHKPLTPAQFDEAMALCKAVARRGTPLARSRDPADIAILEAQADHLHAALALIAKQRKALREIAARAHREQSLGVPLKQGSAGPYTCLSLIDLVARDALAGWEEE